MEIENLRGYFNAGLTLDRSRTLIVGPNNAGKTSVLRLLDWVLNQLVLDPVGPRLLSDADAALLLPARNTRHRARRLSLTVEVPDRRSWSKFQCKAGIATLRVNIRLTPDRSVYLALGETRRSEPADDQANAVELLKRLRETYHYIFVPSFRDARTVRFTTTIQTALRRRVEERALHSAQSGVPAEHRKAAQHLSKMKSLVLDLASPLWRDISSRLPAGLARDGSLILDASHEDFLRFFEDRLRLTVSTGDHDSSHVAMTELGSGLQSLLDLAVQESESPSGQITVLAVEEPEAFLHPSAQRLVISRLLGSSNVDRVVITTHSRTVVEEARFGDVVLCRDQRFYEPAAASDDRVSDINSALLSGYGAEMAFAESVLLVEGDSDRQFFERIRRRVAVLDASGAADRCFVVPVGSNSSFAPWIRLLESYGSPADRPIKWLVACDGDSPHQLRRAFKDGGVVLPQDVIDALGAVDAARTGTVAEWREKVEELNLLTEKSGTRIHMLGVDLEDATLSGAGPNTVGALHDALESGEDRSRSALLSRLGSKGWNPIAVPVKAPWVRGLAGDIIPPSQLPARTRNLLRRWLAGAMPSEKAEELLMKWGA